MMDEQLIKIQVNGKDYESKVESRRTLADYLRLDLGLTGTHLGCEHGVCGACTVLMNGNTARSCLTLAVQANNCKVTTIEGLANEDGTLSVLQQAFQECHVGNM